MPTPVKAFTKNSRKSSNGFFCLNKERYLLFSQHHWSTALVFMMFYDLLCDYVDDDVLPVPLTAFWRVFLPTFGSCFLGGWFAQQSCRKRGVCQAKCSEFNGKKPKTLQKPDFCTSYLRRRTFNLRDLRIQVTRLHCSTWTEVWLGWLESTWWCLHWDQSLNFGFSSFVNHRSN